MKGCVVMKRFNFICGAAEGKPQVQDGGGGEYVVGGLLHCFTAYHSGNYDIKYLPCQLGR